jgi:hypothetical protein
MKYRNYNVQLTEKRVEINKLFFIKWVVELKANEDYIFYLNDNLNLINEDKLLNTKNGYKTLVKQLKLIVDKRIIEKTMFDYK